MVMPFNKSVWAAILAAQLLCRAHVDIRKFHGMHPITGCTVQKQWVCASAPKEYSCAQEVRTFARQKELKEGRSAYHKRGTGSKAGQQGGA